MAICTQTELPLAWTVRAANDPEQAEVPVLLDSVLERGFAAQVETGFGRLKNEYGLTPLRVRRIARVTLHASLASLAQLAFALLLTRDT